MALIKCPECREKVSNQSDRCIRCGYPLRRKTLCLASMKLDMIEKNMQKLQNSSAKETDANDDENPITTHLFKMGIVFVLVFFFFGFSISFNKKCNRSFCNRQCSNYNQFRRTYIDNWASCADLCFV